MSDSFVSLFQKDMARYGNENEAKTMRKFHFLLRKTQTAQSGLFKKLYRRRLLWYNRKHHLEIWDQTQIGGGFYLGHPVGVTVNPRAVIGENVNIHKGVTIGQENRGARKGAPVIGDCVWIGINATIVGNVKIGNDVLIAPLTFVNFDVPDHSVVVGNPGKITRREHATEGYISHPV